MLDNLLFSEFTGIHSMKDCSAASNYGVKKKNRKRKEKEKKKKYRICCWFCYQ